MNYVKAKLETVIKVGSLVSAYYLEYCKDFSFSGESHDFWEFLYVDKGTVYVQADETIHLMQSGQIIFHKPNEFHNVKANGLVAPNLVIAAFECRSSQIKWFENKILKVSDDSKQIIGNIIKEARQAFLLPEKDQFPPVLKKRCPTVFGSQQMLRLSLEQLIINLRREEVFQYKLTSSIRQCSETELFDKICIFIAAHITSPLSIDELCRIFPISRSGLKQLFKRKTGGGVIEFYHKERINEAKRLIREKNLNFTAISEQLGFSSVHYFSRHFKIITGMTPSEYTLSVKTITEKWNRVPTTANSSELPV